MNAKEFLNELGGMNWVINRETTSSAAGYNFSEMAEGRFANAPDELKELVQMFVSCANKEDTVWFLSVNDYLSNSDAPFSWNEFEIQSLEVAEEDEITGIKSFWALHLPFMLSVKNGYAFLAVVLSGPNKGEIVIGNEPMYEEVSVVASNLPAFFDLFVSFLKAEIDIPSLNILK